MIYWLLNFIAPNRINTYILISFNIAIGVYSIITLPLSTLLWGIPVYFFLATLFNVGLHRYFSHIAFNVNKFWHGFLTATTFLTLAGSPISFTTAHLPHHKHTDNKHDPVGKTIGFWKSFFFDFNLTADNKIRTPRRLLNDRLGVFVHRNYLLLFISFYTLLFVIDPIWCQIYSVGTIPLIIMYSLTNYFSHVNSFFNYRNYEVKDNSQNNLIHGLIGSEWHNNHHKYPGAWNQKLRWWEIDSSAFFIWMIKK
jgi:stearoyl-CoA desaturase (delta-9 desaturase)